MTSARIKKKLKGTLFDKSRFDWMERERIEELRKLTFSKAAEIQADLLSFAELMKKEDRKDHPISYKMLLKNKK